MRKLVARGRKDGVVLGNVSVDGRFFVDAVDKGMVRIQELASDLLNGLGDGGRKQECLSFRSRRHHLHDSFNILSETHVQ